MAVVSASRNFLPDELERQPFKKPIELLKEHIRIEDVAAEYTDLKPVGENRLVGRCPIPDHEDRNPSFCVYLESQRWVCFACYPSGGDIVDLEELAGRHAETWTGVQALATRYQIEFPTRSRCWHERQSQKERIREAGTRGITEAYLRRYMNLFVPLLPLGGDQKEVEESVRGLAEALLPVAKEAAFRSVYGD